MIYCLAQIVLIGATPASLLTHGFQGIPTGNPVLVYPFAAVAGLAGLGIFWVTVLHIDAFVSPFGTGMIYQTSTSRIGYGLARNRYYPQIFQWTDRRGVPWFSLIMAFVFGIFFLLPFPSWTALVGLVTGASVLMYAGAPLSLGAFRRQVPDAPRPYRVPFAVVISPLGFIIANMIIYWSGFNVIWKLGVCIVIGYIIIGICMVLRPGAAAAGLEIGAVAAGLPDRHGLHLLVRPIRQRRAADQQRPPPVRVGHADGGGLQRGHLLLGTARPAAQAGDGAAGREAVRADGRRARATAALTRPFRWRADAAPARAPART